MADTLMDKVKDVVEDVKDAAEDVVDDIKEAVHIEPKEKPGKKEPGPSSEGAQRANGAAGSEKAKKRVKPASKRAGMTVKAKKKTAVARATIKKGKGKIMVNHMNLGSYATGYLLDFIREPLEIAGDVAKEYDITVAVKGSGFMSQAVAVRACLAKAIVRAKGKKYKEMFQNYDRMLLVDDVRKVESKKPLGKKARKKWQSSKR